MFKLFIVDDEPLERDGMAKLIPWRQYDVELAGTAWNGAEALERIREMQPDIVITDIKMPVMNGVELIRRTGEIFPDIEFIVLSGYGEYEYTSRTMELGVQFYLLKPCDETQIIGVLDKVKKKIKEYRRSKDMLHYALPKAEEQLFRNMLLGRETVSDDRLLLLDERAGSGADCRLLALRLPDGIEAGRLRDLTDDIIAALREAYLRLYTRIMDKAYFLLDGVLPQGTIETLSAVLEKHPAIPRAALSESRPIGSLHELLRQTDELFVIGDAERRTELLLYYELLKSVTEHTASLLQYEKLEHADSYETLAYEACLLFLKMEAEKYPLDKRLTICSSVIGLMNAEDGTKKQCADIWDRFAPFVKTLADASGYLIPPGNKREELGRRILLTLYRHIMNPKLGLQFAAREVLYMNEEYLGRVFMRQYRMKVSDYIARARIDLAKQIIAFRPDMRISTLAELVGYAPDGQNFSRTFRRIESMSPSEYYERILRERTGK